MKILVFLIICWCFEYVTPISVNNGGYEDMYIVIKDNNEDSEFLLERIQKIFTDASKLLLTATKNHLYFGKIKIIVPKTWLYKEKYKKAMIPVYIKQKIIIDNVEQYGIDTPRVIGITACGKGGLYMYLNSKSFILKTGRTSWGLHDNVIVHEFGHLRYGLFDEYPIHSGSSQFYQSKGEWKPTRCTEEIEGKIGIGNQCTESPACDYKNTGKILDGNCNFCPKQNQNVEASLMSYQWIDSVRLFFQCQLVHVRFKLLFMSETALNITICYLHNYLLFCYRS
ncbi:calcium-activated chloride channel regulator 1-like [Ruditapes philippinarum]|uniref:calcium-activated chloride channel regulator 1-like n=1 Tax=Ruditapes philippinarum TaxID=129788 RepID=UPI00295BEEB4|nr:calcium-activated chloride channel regulator 1-like [Ruditapes philippinarum]